MELGKSHKILLSPALLCGLFLLVINDFYLKARFHNDLTGKLSDFAGLFVFPLFFAALFPSKRFGIYVSTGIAFIFWKSPLSQGLIDLFNQLAPFSIGRTVDLTDLIALSIIPVSYFCFLKRSGTGEAVKTSVVRRLAVISVILASVFAFTATSYQEDRTVLFDKKYMFRGGTEVLISKMRRLDKIYSVQFRPES